MSLQLQRAVLIAASVTAATAATLAEDCRGVLQLLQGRSDAELAARCRASFEPELCREVGSSLGAQPWSSQRIGESCSRFAAASVEMDERGLEAAVEAKIAAKQRAAPAPLEEAVATKLMEPAAASEVAPAATAEQVIPGGAIGHLLSKTKAKAQEAQEAQKAPLRTLMTPLEAHDVAAPDLKGKTSLASKDAQKSRKAPLRQASPLEKNGIPEIEPEKVHNARLALRHAVERAERTLADTGSGLGLFGQLPELEDVSVTPVLGVGLFAVAAAFVSLSAMRTRRYSARAATAGAFLLDVEQDPVSPASTVVE